MTRTVAALLLACGVAVAAPVPKAAPQLEDVYGEIADKKSGYKFEMSKAGLLTVTVPATEEKVAFDAKAFRAPQVVKEIEGDFMLTVRIGLSAPKEAKVGGKADEMTVTAGVAISQSDAPQFGACAGITHYSTDKGWRGRFSDCRKYDKTGSGAGSWDLKLDPSSKLVVRLTRQGDRVLSEFQTEEGEWQGWSNMRITDMAGTVKVGPVAFGCIDKEFSATFDQYEIKPLTKDEKK